MGRAAIGRGTVRLLAMSADDLLPVRIELEKEGHVALIDPHAGDSANRSMAVTAVADTAERAVMLCKSIFIPGGEEGLRVCAGVER